MGPDRSCQGVSLSSTPFPPGVRPLPFISQWFGKKEPQPTPSTRQLFEFDSTNSSDAEAKPPGKPYPPYLLAEFSWNNITDSLDPATLSATFRGHPNHDPTGAFANGSLAFRVRVWE